MYPAVGPLASTHSGLRRGLVPSKIIAMATCIIVNGSYSIIQAKTCKREFS